MWSGEETDKSSNDNQTRSCMARSMDEDRSSRSESRKNRNGQKKNRSSTTLGNREEFTLPIRMTKNTKKFSKMRGESWKDLWHQPCRAKRSPNGITKVVAKLEIASEKIAKMVHECIVESHESKRQGVESSQSKNLEDHITDKGFTSMSHFKKRHTSLFRCRKR